MKSFQPLKRRTMLKATGVGIGLPLLEAMAPVGKTAFAADQQPTRFMACFTPVGMYRKEFHPKDTGKNYTMSKTLQPCTRHRDDMLVLKNVYNAAQNPKPEKGAHAHGTGAFLTGRRVPKSGLKHSISVDQVIADHLQGQTPFPSLQFNPEAMGRSAGANCDSGFACAYVYHVSWNKSGNYNPNLSDPVKIFNSLYGKVPGGVGGESVDPAQKSVLDYVLGDIQKLKGKLGTSDNEKLDEYFTSIRNLENDLSSTGGVDSAACQNKNAPPNEQISKKSKDAERVIDLMSDLAVMAFQCDLTRVITFMFDRGASYRLFSDQFGTNDNHHSYSHHGNRQSVIDKLLMIEKWEMERYALLIDKLKATKDASGKRLLDSSMVFLSSEVNEGNAHRYQDMPFVLAGNANGKLKTGECIALPDSRRDFCNLFETFIDVMGKPNHGSFGVYHNNGGKVPEILA